MTRRRLGLGAKKQDYNREWRSTNQSHRCSKSPKRQKGGSLRWKGTRGVPATFPFAAWSLGTRGLTRATPPRRAIVARSGNSLGCREEARSRKCSRQATEKEEEELTDRRSSTRMENEGQTQPSSRSILCRSDPSSMRPRIGNKNNKDPNQEQRRVLEKRSNLTAARGSYNSCRESCIQARRDQSDEERINRIIHISSVDVYIGLTPGLSSTGSLIRFYVGEPNRLGYFRNLVIHLAFYPKCPPCKCQKVDNRD